MTSKDAVKGKNILRDPRVMLSVDDENPPFAFVLIDGAAVASELPPDELLPWSTRLARRYLGAELAEAYGKRTRLRANCWYVSLWRWWSPAKGSLTSDAVL